MLIEDTFCLNGVIHTCYCWLCCDCVYFDCVQFVILSVVWMLWFNRIMICMAMCCVNVFTYVWLCYICWLMMCYPFQISPVWFKWLNVIIMCCWWLPWFQTITCWVVLMCYVCVVSLARDAKSCLWYVYQGLSVVLCDYIDDWG